MDLRYYEFGKLQCIEMTIWPLLYTNEKWCESYTSGQVYQKSVCCPFFFYCMELLTNNHVHIFHNHFFNKLYFNRRPDYQPNTCLAQSSNPRYSIFPTMLTSCISSLIGGCTKESQVFSSYS